MTMTMMIMKMSSSAAAASITSLQLSCLLSILFTLSLYIVFTGDICILQCMSWWRHDIGTMPFIDEEPPVTGWISEQRDTNAEL